jgi:glutamine synthetase
MLEAMGISVEFSHHEGGPGQQEIDLRYADALTTADNIMTFRTVVREVALEQGISATFMPKPFTTHPGSGMHTHLSLFEGDRNAFFEAGRRVPALPDRAPFIAGILRHAPEITAITNQWVNSYKRLAEGGRRRRTSAGATTTARRWCGCRCTSRTRAVDPHRVPRIDSAATPTWPSLLLSAG